MIESILMAMSALGVLASAIWLTRCLVRLRQPAYRWDWPAHKAAWLRCKIAALSFGAAIVMTLVW